MSTTLRFKNNVGWTLTKLVLDEYVKFVNELWFVGSYLPEDDAQAMYVSLAICGEAGELLGVAPSVPNPFNLDHGLILKEAGDVAYYVVRAMSSLETDEYKPVDLLCEISPDPTKKDWSRKRDTLPLACGELCEYVKKMIRDDRRDDVTHAELLMGVFAAVVDLAAEFGMRPNDIVQTNMAKLRLRVKHGTLRGSGDDR